MINRSIYISGIDSDHPAQSATMVKSITDSLKKMGFKIVTPGNMPFPQVIWTDNVINRLTELGVCRAIYMLPNWHDDIIARIELTAAMNQKLYTIFHPASLDDLRDLKTALDV